MVGIRTIEELEALRYGYNRSEIMKADAPLLTSTAGVYNAVYGGYAWAQLNLEANAFGVLPKNPWDKSGWRLITTRPTLTTTAGNTVLGGTSQGGNIAEAAKPAFQEVEVLPKVAQLPFQASTVMEWLATHSQNDIWGGLGALRLYMAVQHKEFIQQMLLADVETEAAAAGADYTGTLNWETLDRIISSSTEEAQLGGAFNDYYDPWDFLNRDGSALFDATVKTASAGGVIGGANGTLTDDLIQELLQDIRIRGGKDPSVFLGSHQVYREIQAIYNPQVRYGVLGETFVQVDVNGIKTFNGIGTGIHVSSVYGIPFIPTKDAPKRASDTNEVGRLLALDTSDPEGFGYPRLGLQIAVPTTYNEATRQTPGWPFINTAFVEDALYWTMGETICRSFISQGKIRDIQV